MMCAGAVFAEEKITPLPATNLPSALELYQNYIDANGGRINMASLSTLLVKGSLIQSDGESVDFKLYRKRPQMMRMKYEFDRYQVEQISDGIEAWQVVSPNVGESSIFDITGEALESLLRDNKMEGPFFHAGMRDDWIVPVAEEEVRGQMAIRIEVSPEANIGYDVLWLSSENFQEVKLQRSLSREASNEAEKVEEIYFTEFDKVAGIWLANEIEYFTDGELTQRVLINEVRANVGIFDSYFEKR